LSLIFSHILVLLSFQNPSKKGERHACLPATGLPVY
jgi:hypothetical protein